MDLGLKKIKPLVIKKNDINIAVYGIGYQKDQTLNYLLEREEIDFEKTNSTFRILIIH